MIKYLTEKLKQNTLDEERAVNKVEESDHDSGTESDDQNSAMESDECDRSTASMTSQGGIQSGQSSLVTPTSSPYFLDSALPSDCDLTYDHHSSEEELEVINGSVTASCDTAKRVNRSPFGKRCRSVSSALPEKRKWSEAMDSESPGEPSTPCHRPRVRISTRRHTSSSDENMLCAGKATSSTASHKSTSGCSSGASSDDDTAPSGAFAPIAPSTPVNFSRSPPLNAHKPPTFRSLSPPLKMLNCDSATVEQPRSQSVLSPRYKRHRLTPTQRAHHIQRPCLDFEKMQQMKENAVTTWRHHSNGDHGGELSLYCW